MADVSGTEGTALTFTVTLSDESGKTVTVDYATSVEIGDTATSGTDFTAKTSTTLTFEPGDPGDTTKTFTVQTTDDTDIEEDETFTVTLSNPSDATISDATAKGTIENDDEAALDVLVSNYPDGSGSDFSLNFVQSGNSQRHYIAQTFTAGAGFTLTAVDIPFRRVPDNSRVTVSLHALNGSKPGPYLAELDLSGALAVGDNTFAAPAGTALAAGSYFVRVRWHSGDTNNLKMTDGPDEETSAESGWSIEDRSQYSASGSSWSNWNQQFAMRVRGTIDGVPRVATGGVRIESDPDAHDSYGVGEEIEVAVGFTDDVTVDTTSGTPRVELTVGSNTRYADYSASDSSADELAFLYEVTVDDHDQDGVSIDADALELNGGAIHKDGDTSTNAVLGHAALDADSDHRVNRDPFIVSDGVSVISDPQAAADTYGLGEVIEIEVEFSAAVDATTGTDFVLSVSGPKRAPLLRGSGTKKLVFGYTVVASDDDDSGIWIGDQDRTLVGNRQGDPQDGEITSAVTDRAADLDHDSPGVLSGHKVDGSRTTGNVAPSFTSDATISVAENETAVVTVAATDSDADDSVTGYAITGGADMALFEIGATSGELTFKSAPNFEDAQDQGTNNTYVVDVTATSGAGTRVKTATQTITVTVTDVSGEAPGKPGTPTVSAGSATSLRASWSAPSNAGPPITRYDVRHRTSSPEGSWTEKNVPSIAAVIESLSENTSYDVQVRAINAEGTGAWSDSGNGTTDAAADAANASPSFSSSSATISVAENQTTVVTVLATDSDADDDITGYAITGGPDQTFFSIGETSGALTFEAAPNHESPQDQFNNNTYVVDVTATSGTGTRVKTATQTITVTVTDVDTEAPGKPAKPRVSAASATSLRVNWSAPDNEGPPITDYDVRYRAGNSGGWSDASHTGKATTATLTGLTGLTEDTSYQVQVRATNAEGTGAWSDSGSEEDELPADTSTTGRVEVGGAAVGGDIFEPVKETVTWTIINTVGEEEVVEGTVYDFDTDWFAVELEKGRTYQIDMKGAILVAPGTLQDPDLTLPLPQINAIYNEDGEFLVNTRSRDESSAHHLFRVTFHAHDSGTHYIAASGESFEWGGYELTVIDITEDDDEHTAAQQGLKNLRAVEEKGGVRLTWQPPDGAAVTGYRIERRRAGGQDSGPQRSHGQPRDHHTLVEDTGNTETSYVDESAEQGVEYEYRVTARNESGPGESSDWVRAGPASASNNPATGAPTISGTTQVGETLTADMSGIADADGLSGETFAYQWVSSDGTTDTDIENATGSTYTLIAADQGKSVKVRVTFTDDGGNEETLTSAPTGPVWGDGLPGAPRNLTATPGNREVSLSWDPPDDNGNAPATRYRIEWRVDGQDYGTSQWGTSRETTYTTNDQANLANGVKYFFRVKAENGSGNSYGPYGPASEEVSSTPTSGSAVDLDTPVLSEPEILHHGMVQLDWQDIEDAGWYVVQYYHLEDEEWLDLPAEGVDIAFHGSSAVVSNLHGLSWLRVGAASCDGASEWSQIEELYGTNASDWEGVPVPDVEEGDEIEPCPVVLGTPVLSDTETLHHGMVQLDWQDIEDAGWYVVQYYHLEDEEWLDLPAEGVDIAFHGSSAVVSNLHGLSWLRVGAASCDGESEWSQIEELYGTNASDWEGVPVPEVAEGDEIEPCSEDADTPDNSPATGAPTISGTAQVGETLTANTSGVIDADGLSNVQYEYQWLADDADISGATNATYTLVADDEGKAVTVQVSFTDDAGNEETLTSAATDAVAAAPVHAKSGADLAVGTPSVNDASPFAGSQFTLSVTVTNAGDGASEATRLRYYRSTDSTITSSDTEQRSESVGALAAAGTSDHDGGMTAPSEAGTYYYGACVDSVTNESDTTDNCSSSVTVTVSEPAPDLVVIGIAATDNIVTGGSFRVGVTVTNQGDAQSAETTLRWKQLVDGTTTEIGTVALTALTRPQGSFKTILLTAPSTPGTSSYWACVDSVAGESDTTNNLYDQYARSIGLLAGQAGRARRKQLGEPGGNLDCTDEQ